MEENKQKNILGIISLILGIIAILFSYIFAVSIPLSIAAIIIAIIALVKKQKKPMPIVSIVLSSIAIVTSVVFIIIRIFISNFMLGVKSDIEGIGKNIGASEKNITDSVLGKLISGLEQLRDIDEGMSYEVDIENKLDGYSWKASDGSLLELNDDGTYYWYKNESDKTDNYYTGTYRSYLGDKAIDKIDDEFGFNEEAYEQNTAILRTDIYYLELKVQEMILNGKNYDATRPGKYAIFFRNANDDKCEGMNLDTQNLVYFTKVK